MTSGVSISTHVSHPPSCSVPTNLFVVKGSPSWELVKPAPGNEPPPRRTGHIMLSMDDTIYMWVMQRLEFLISHLFAALEGRTDHIITMTLGRLTSTLEYGRNSHV
jgi:hypothetical protein